MGSVSDMFQMCIKIFDKQGTSMKLPFRRKKHKLTKINAPIREALHAHLNLHLGCGGRLENGRS